MRPAPMCAASSPAAWPDRVNGTELAFCGHEMFNNETMPVTDEQTGKAKRLLTAAALIVTGGIAFALAQWSHGAMELAAWFIVSFCAGGLVSQFQRPRPS